MVRTSAICCRSRIAACAARTSGGRSALPLGRLRVAATAAAAALRREGRRGSTERGAAARAARAAARRRRERRAQLRGSASSCPTFSPRCPPASPSARSHRRPPAPASLRFRRRSPLPARVAVDTSRVPRQSQERSVHLRRLCARRFRKPGATTPALMPCRYQDSLGMPSKKSTTPVSSEYSAPTTSSPSFSISCSSTSEPCRRWFDRGADVGAHGLPHQRVRVVPQLGRQQRLAPTAGRGRRSSAGCATGSRSAAGAPRAWRGWRRTASGRARRPAACRSARRRTRRCRPATARRCCRRRG